MANKKFNKNLILCILAAVVIVVVIIAIILASHGTKLDDSYFVSDDTKYVLTIENDSDPDSGEVKTHFIYYYSGETVKALKIYQEYIDEEKAKIAFEQLKEYSSDSYKDISLDGKYVILTAKESEYENITIDEFRRQIQESMIEDVEEIECDDGDIECENQLEDESEEVPIEDDDLTEE